MTGGLLILDLRMLRIGLTECLVLRGFERSHTFQTRLLKH